MQMTNHSMKTYSALIIREVPIKVIVRNDLLPVSTKPKIRAGRTVEKRKPNTILMGCYISSAIFKRNTEALQEKAVPLPDCYSCFSHCQDQIPDVQFQEGRT